MKPAPIYYILTQDISYSTLPSGSEKCAHSWNFMGAEVILASIMTLLHNIHTTPTSLYYEQPNFKTTFV